MYYLFLIRFSYFSCVLFCNNRFLFHFTLPFDISNYCWSIYFASTVFSFDISAWFQKYWFPKNEKENIPSSSLSFGLVSQQSAYQQHRRDSQVSVWSQVCLAQIRTQSISLCSFNTYSNQRSRSITHSITRFITIFVLRDAFDHPFDQNFWSNGISAYFVFILDVWI